MNDIADILDLAFLGVLGYAALDALEKFDEPTKRSQLVRDAVVQEEKVGEEEEEEMEGLAEIEIDVTYEFIYQMDPNEFLEKTRMNFKTFRLLGSLMESVLKKRSARKPIPPSFRLFITLVFLSQGTSRRDIAQMYGIGLSTTRKIINDTCSKLWKTLIPMYLKPPSKQRWKTIAEEFLTELNLPNCIGAIDGKLIEVCHTGKIDPNYANYRGRKGRYSFVLLAACDVNYTFTAADVGFYGSQTGGVVFNESTFGEKMLRGKVNIPPPSRLPNSNIKCPYYIAGDAAFRLKPFVMRPYPRLHLKEDEEYFNERLLRGKNVIENAFGVLTAKWRILKSVINMMPSNAEQVVRATIVLHNFVKQHETDYCPAEYVDVCNDEGAVVQTGEWRNEARPLKSLKSIAGSNNPCRIAFRIRVHLKNYFLSNKTNNLAT